MTVRKLESDAAAQYIEAFIRERFQIPDHDARFSRQINLWEEGYIDSLGVVEMIGFLERRFTIALPEDVIFSPEFTSIDGIARYVIRLKAV